MKGEQVFVWRDLNGMFEKCRKNEDLRAYDKAIPNPIHYDEQQQREIETSLRYLKSMHEQPEIKKKDFGNVGKIMILRELDEIGCIALGTSKGLFIW